MGVLQLPSIHNDLNADALLGALHQVSQNLAGDPAELPRILNGLVSDVTDTLRAETFGVSLTLNEDEPEQTLDASAESLERSHVKGPRFQLSRDIAVRRRRYGRLELTLRKPVWSPEELFLFVDALAQQLALAAERYVMARERDRLRLEKRRAEAELLSRKVLNRASGMIAAERGWTVKKALDWLRGESVRSGRPLIDFSQNIIDGVLLQRQLGGNARLWLDRTA